MAGKKIETVSDYIATLPSDSRRFVKGIRAIIRKAAPRVTERISYGMPTFDLAGERLLYIAAWKEHVGLYPLTKNMAKRLGKEVASYQSAKSALNFPLGEPLPVDLIRRVVACRIEEVAGVK